MKRGLILAGGCALACLASNVLAQTIEERARAAAQASRKKSSDSDALQSNYLTPGLGGQPIATIDNNQQFTPSLACQKSATALEILAQPGLGGDITTLRLTRDKDLDGTFDETLNVPVPISGICANGVIACNQASWDQCRNFQWTVGGAGEVRLAQVELTALAGCYCVNNSCGDNLVWGNMASVLKDLGGGVVGALTTADPRIGIAQAQIDGPVIRYTGAQMTACTANPSVTATTYRSDPAAIQGDAYNIAEASSLFQALAGSAIGSGKAQEIRACTITRDIAVKSWDYDDIMGVGGSIASVTSCGAGCRRYQIRGPGNCGNSPPIHSATFDPIAPDRILSAHRRDGRGRLGTGAGQWPDYRFRR